LRRHGGVWAGSDPAAAQQRPPAKPEPDAALLQRAPKLAVTGKIIPLKEALEIGGTGWGPFRRLCVARMLIRQQGQGRAGDRALLLHGGGGEDEGGTWRLAIVTDPIRAGPRVAFATSRDAAGEVGAMTIAPPDGMTVPPERRERMQAVGRVDMAGRCAIDIATGKVLQHGSASFLFMAKNPGKAMPDLRWHGVSRQSLE
jgi:hypothetical protein